MSNDELPVVSLWLQNGFHRFIRPLLRRHFHAIAVDRVSIETLSIRDHEPLIVYGNHPSWWDPIVSHLINRTLLFPRQFYAPIGVAVNGEGDVYVVDAGNDRVQRFGGCGHPFIDVPDWVTSAVNWASCGEYLTGYADDTFRPNRPMTRAEVARFLYRVAGSPDVSGLAAHGFSDVPTWVEDPVRWLAANGYITGYGDGTFRPNLAITRAQVTRMLYRIAGSPSGAPDHGFTDVPAWVDTAVDWIVDPVNDPPYATGYDDGTFRPNLDITRAQTTRMACRINTTPGTC